MWPIPIIGSIQICDGDISLDFTIPRSTLYTIHSAVLSLLSSANIYHKRMGQGVGVIIKVA
jgi:hypothetical protein